MSYFEAIEAAASNLRGLNDVADIETCETANRIADEYGADHVAAVMSLLAMKREAEAR